MKNQDYHEKKEEQHPTQGEKYVTGEDPFTVYIYPFVLHLKLNPGS